MRACLIVLAVLVLPSLARAGLYNSAEPVTVIPMERTLAEVGDMRSIAIDREHPDPASRRAKYLRQKDRLEEALRAGTLSPNERADLGACYLRLRLTASATKDAIRLLRAGPRDHPLLQANLATAYFLDGDLDLAIRHQEEVLRLWPRSWPGWNRSLLDWYQGCEQLFLDL